MEWIQLSGKIHHGNNYLWWWRSHQPLSREGLRIFQILCYDLEGWTRTRNRILFGKISWLGSGVHQSSELWTHLIVSRWNSSGIFSQDSPHCSSATKSKSSCLKWANQQNNLQDGSSSCRCSMTSHGDLKTMNRNVLLTPHLCLYLHKGFPAGRWSFLGLGSEKKWYSPCNERPQGEWDRVAELMMIKFGESGHPVFLATSPLSRGTLQKQRRKKIINTLLRRWRYDWNFFALFLFLLISSVSTEQSQICVKNTVLVKQVRSDPYWQDDLTHCLCQQVRWWQHLHLRSKFPHKKIYCKSTKNEWKGSHNKVVW